MTTDTPERIAPDLVEQSLRRAKRPRSILAGPYGHPLHAVAVTVPIGAWTASLVFDLAGRFAARPASFARGASWLVGIGLVGAAGAGSLGLLDLRTIDRGTHARRVALTHLTANVAASSLFAGSLLVRSRSRHHRAGVAGVLLSLTGYGLVGLSGVLGGELTYRYGVRVADEDTQRSGYAPKEEAVPRA